MALKKICICILAHNEEKHIANTIQSICEGNDCSTFDIKVYANGCTDDTAEIVKKLTYKLPNLFLHQLSPPSKPLAWNKAFNDNFHEIIFFSDADLVLQPGSVSVLAKELTNNPKTVIACCQHCPMLERKSLQQRIVGFMQIPLSQDFISGGFYAVRRSLLAEIMSHQGLEGIPLGVTGDDAFLGLLIPQNKIKITDHKCYYVPPSLLDYCRYLARIKWQNNQIQFFYYDKIQQTHLFEENCLGKIFRKIKSTKGPSRLLLGMLSSTCRTIFKLFTWCIIAHYYKQIGPVHKDGAHILSETTRSSSTK